MTKEREFDLHDRLIEYSVRIIPLLQETDELISILYRSIETAQKNAKKR